MPERRDASIAKTKLIIGLAVDYGHAGGLGDFDLLFAGCLDGNQKLRLVSCYRSFRIRLEPNLCLRNLCSRCRISHGRYFSGRASVGCRNFTRHNL